MGLILDSSVLITAERRGVTGVELGYSVATANLRHFQLIPGLQILSL
jgi:hypothetical protein